MRNPIDVPIDLYTLPHPDMLPIPEDVRPNSRWSPLMIEIADHIGPLATLQLLDRFGGQFVDVPRNGLRNPFRDALGDGVAFEISRVFGGEQLHLPTGASALRHARRQGVVARVRAGDLNLTQAARILRTSRRYIGQLVNQSDEGLE